jgi:hypothetical protein
MKYYRHPKTHQESSLSAIHMAEGIYVRPRRQFRTPLAWDIRPIASSRDRNWKRYRRFQYK